MPIARSQQAGTASADLPPLKTNQLTAQAVHRRACKNAPITRSNKDCCMSNRHQAKIVATGIAVTLIGALLPTPAHAADESSALWNIGPNQAYGVRAAGAWSKSTGAGAVIGVIDTGITPHPDLTGSDTSITGGNVLPGFDFVGRDATSEADGNGWDADPTDAGTILDEYGRSMGRSWHGTHVAGIAAAMRNGTGVVGVAPGAKVVPIRVVGSNWTADRSNIPAAIRWGAGLPVDGAPTNPHPADVLNLSIAWDGGCTADLQAAIDAAVGRGTAVVVAAGNNNRRAIDQVAPVSCNNVIRVLATTQDGKLEGYTNVGSNAVPATIAAPGTVMSTCPLTAPAQPCRASYGTASGTSQAAPHVAGVIALLRSMNPDVSVAQVTALITKTATPINEATCTANGCGAGIVNAEAAVNELYAQLHPIAPSPLEITTLALPTGVRVGTALRASYTVTPSTAVSTFRWYRNGVVISGATQATYVPVPADLGRSLTVEVSSALDGTRVLKTSRSCAVTYGAFALKTAPRMIGTFRVGRKLTLYRGAWSPSPSTYSYQWLRDGKAIRGATKSSYKLKSADRRHKVSLKVTVRRSAFLSRVAVTTRLLVR